MRYGGELIMMGFGGQEVRAAFSATRSIEA
jgi:hypothetical protein